MAISCYHSHHWVICQCTMAVRRLHIVAVLVIIMLRFPCYVAMLVILIAIMINAHRYHSCDLYGKWIPPMICRYNILSIMGLILMSPHQSCSSAPTCSTIDGNCNSWQPFPLRSHRMSSNMYTEILQAIVFAHWIMDGLCVAQQWPWSCAPS